MLFQHASIRLDEIDSPECRQQQIKLFVARFDRIHPIVSGNKLFKLHYFLEYAKQQQKPIISFGGAFSNHLVATSYACNVNQIKCLGIVRGEKAPTISESLNSCLQNKMELQFINRTLYKSLTQRPIDESFSKPFLLGKDLLNQLDIPSDFTDAIVVPEGGFHPVGAHGAELMLECLKDTTYSHLCAALGTGTMVAGLLRANQNKSQLIAIPTLKNLTDIPERLTGLGAGNYLQQLKIMDNYHFNGYAKFNEQLLKFMNDLFINYKIPSDFVYTGKLLYAITDMIKNNYFEKGATIVCIHSGGLQGNHSLKKGSLVF